MAKQPKTNTNAPKVPDAEPVGDPALFNTADQAAEGGTDAQTGNPPLSADAEATGVAAPVASSSTDNQETDSTVEVTATVDLEKPQVEKEPVSTDGGVTVNELSAGSVTAEKINSNTITIGKISAEANQESTTGNSGASDNSGGLSETAAQSILAKVLGVDAAPEKRGFFLLRGPVRHNNIRYERGKPIILTEAEHAELYEKQRVGDWEDGEVLD